MPTLADLLDRADLDPSTRCRIWRGATRRGYACLVVKYRPVSAHRLAYSLAHQVPLEHLDGVVIRHACDNPLCVNPAHLLPGTPADNVADMMKRGRHGAAKLTHCPHGHLYDEANTAHTSNGRRRCRTCRAVVVARYARRVRLRRAAAERIA